MVCAHDLWISRPRPDDTGVTAPNEAGPADSPVPLGAAQISTPGPALDHDRYDDFSKNDVAFIFPRTSGMATCLWTEIEVIEKVSGYWKRMFGLDYVESSSQLEKLSGWKNNFETDLANVLEEHQMTERADLLLVDSDDEAGDEERVPASKLSAASSVIRYVVITDASVKSYRALFWWIDTRLIEFAKLKSTGQSSGNHALSSPKSMYALAHKLEIKDLQKAALANFSSQLTAKNALQELFSGHAAVYPELSAAAMRAVVANAKSIKAAGGPEYIKEVLRSGEVDLEYASAAVAELFGKM